MAAVSLPQLGGYDYEIISEVPTDWECLVCHLTLKDPVQILGCGHRLCEICIGSVLRRPYPACPADRKPITRDKIFPDVACHRKILDLMVRCPYMGCSWTGELRNAEDHQNGCSFQVLCCPNPGCNEKLIKKNLTSHVSFDCAWRMTNCEYCELSFYRNQEQIHLAACPKFPVQCPNKCGVKDIPRDKLEAHVRDECLETEVQCDYKNLGCKAMIPRSKVKSHSEDQVERHLALALRGLEATQYEVRALVSLVQDQSQQLKRLELELGSCKERAKSYAPYIWKIPNFDTVLQRAVAGEEETIFSEPFYSQSNGYKFKIKMYPNGGSLDNQDELVKGKYLSLYIVAVSGEYDSVLPWPFTHCVSLTLVDQNPIQEDRKNISNPLNFKNCKDSSMPDTEQNIGWGFPKFVSHSVLNSRSYIKKNIIYVIANVIKK